MAVSVMLFSLHPMVSYDIITSFTCRIFVLDSMSPSEIMPYSKVATKHIEQVVVALDLVAANTMKTKAYEVHKCTACRKIKYAHYIPKD